MESLKNHLDHILNMFNKKIFLVKENITSSIVCEINIDNIFINGSDFCHINIINNCINNALLSEQLFLDSVYEYTKYVSKKERKEIEDFFGVDKISELKTQGNDLISECKLSANTNNSINIGNVFIGKCNYDKKIDFNFVNTGSSNVTCIMNKVFNKLQPETDILKPFIIDQNFVYISYLIIVLFLFMFLNILFFKSRRFSTEKLLLF